MKSIRTSTRFYPLILTAIILAALTHYYIALFIPPGQSTTAVVVEFETGASFKQITKTLKEKGLIRDLKAFTLLATLRGSMKKVQAGEYELNATMLPAGVLEKLEKGLVIRHQITIPEGYNIREIAELLEQNSLSQKEKFLAKASDKAFLPTIGIGAATAEGFLFPDTYQFPKGMSEETIIKKMVSRFREVSAGDLEMGAKAAGLSVKEVVTLASIVEKETGDASERPRIARVFLNRLKNGIPLQSDPTVIYGIKDFNGNLTRKDLLTKTPYNTYRRRGLPPGPIANPGADSIKAVLYPEEGPYLYFVSRNDGTHYFSRTLSEHNRAVYKYQLKR
ncbi:MAG: endolytic transglycosylase MltG [Deltaproteobacteria bacterium]